MYVLGGTLHVEQNGHHILKQGQGIIMRLTEKHKYYTDESDICEILFTHFNGRQVEGFLKLIEEISSMPAIFEEERIAGIIYHCFIIYNGNPAENEFLISVQIYDMIISILQSLRKEKALINVNPRMEFMNKATQYIEKNLYKRITLEGFAKHFNLSPYHFCRVFEKHFSMSPMKYVLAKKIEISKFMLSYTSDSISTIASSLGFTDQSHFSKTFKSYQGISPLEYRTSFK